MSNMNAFITIYFQMRYEHFLVSIIIFEHTLYKFLYICSKIKKTLWPKCLAKGRTGFNRLVLSWLP